MRKTTLVCNQSSARDVEDTGQEHVTFPVPVRRHMIVVAEDDPDEDEKYDADDTD